jgi:Carboxypeptidase regulatory-like domain
MAAMNQRSVVWRMFPVMVVLGAVFVVISQAQKTRTGSISGHVVDSVGATIKGATIFVHKHASSEAALEVAGHTDIKGNFTLELPEGGYDVLVTASGFMAGVQTVPVRPGKAKSVTWALKALGCDFPTMNCDTFR